MASPLFSASPIDLGAAALTPLSGKDAAPLAAAAAAIDPWKRMDYAASALTAFLTRDDPALRRYAIHHEGTLAGAAAIRHPWLKGPYLEFLAVLPPAQGRGIGSALLRWMEGEVRGRDRNLWVLASDFNIRALAFYERHGFERAIPLPGVAAEGFTEILMRKRLA